MTNARLLDLERRLEQQEGALARLLAALPARADAIEEARLHQILQNLVEHALTLFPGRAVTGTAVPESDRDTEACHRLVLRIADGREIDPADFAERAFEVQRYAARSLSQEEHRAVVLIVEPHYIHAGGDRES